MISRIHVIILIAALLNVYIHEVNSQQSPCPNVYEFKYDGRNWYGEITLPISGRGQILVDVVLAVGESIAKENSGGLNLISSSAEVYNAINTSGSIKYKHVLPNTENLPVIRSIKMNGIEYCSNPTGTAIGPVVTTVTVQNILDTGDDNDNTQLAPVQPPQPAPVPIPIRPRPPVPVQPQPQQPSFSTHFAESNDDNWLLRLPSQCGYQKSELSIIQTIINGQKVQPGEYPWLVALKDHKHVFFCGGNLVTNKHVITAAHCISSPNMKILIELGRYNHDDLSETVILRTTANIVINPNYRKNTGHGDVAILTLTEEVRFSDKIRPICLWPYGTSPVGTKGYVAGWGADLSGYTQNEPMKTSVNVVSQERCNEAHELFAGITSDKTFCAGGEKSGPCVGDSGGGMYLQLNNRWYLKGIISTSIGNIQSCNVDLYAVYADISTYLDWLKIYLVS